MPRSNKTITFSLPIGVAERIAEVAKQQGRSRSELLREAVVRYAEESEWRELVEYGERTARGKGLGSEDVAALVGEYRTEVGSSGAAELP